MLFKTKSPKKLNSFMQTLKNGHKVFDFTKIAKYGAPINILLTERGAKGKTLNVKELLRKHYIKTGESSMWLGNTIPMIQKYLKDYKADFMTKRDVQQSIGKTATKFWEDTIAKGDPEKASAEISYKGKTFISAISMNHTEMQKGSRPKRKYLVWDEFNVKFETVRDPITKFDSLLHTSEDIVNSTHQDLQMFIFGNNKSLNNPIIYNLGVSSVEDEITEFRDEDGQLLVLVISPQFKESERAKIADRNKDNWIYKISGQLGTQAHSYYNESLYDEMQNIKRYLVNHSVSSILKPIFSVYHSKRFYNVYEHKKTGFYHLIAVRKEQIIAKTLLFTLNTKDIYENAIKRRQLTKPLRKAFERDQMTFEDVSTRELFISSLK